MAKSAIEIKTKLSKQVVFMDEPGEFVLVLNRIDDVKLSYELRWYEDWCSWGMIPEDRYLLKLSGETTIAKYANQVRQVLLNLMSKHTLEEYKKLWIEHDFPAKELFLIK